jgi:hypothetical protein
MRECDILLLVHGDDPMCSEYIPSKLYEYFWMQRPIIATAHDNPQLIKIINDQGHFVADCTLRDKGKSTDASVKVSNHLNDLWRKWKSSGLSDSKLPTPWTTLKSTQELIAWANQL